MNSEYFIFHKSEAKAIAIAVISAVVVFVLLSLYNDYRGHETRQIKRQVKIEIAQIAPEPAHVPAPLRRAK